MNVQGIFLYQLIDTESVYEKQPNHFTVRTCCDCNGL